MTSPTPGASGIVFGGQHHRHGGAVTPAQLAELGKRAGACGVQQLTERRVQQSQHGLRLGIAEAAVEFDHRRSLRGDGESDIQQSGKRAAAPNQFGRNGFDDPADHIAR